MKHGLDPLPRDNRYFELGAIIKWPKLTDLPPTFFLSPLSVKDQITDGNDDFCFAAGTQIVTKRGNVAIEKVMVGDYVMTRQGWKPVLWAGETGIKPVIEKLGLTGTPGHRIITTTGEVTLCDINSTDILHRWNEKLSCIEEGGIIDIQNLKTDSTASIIGRTPTQTKGLFHYTDRFGLIILARYLKDMLFIIKTKIHLTTNYLTLKLCPVAFINVCTSHNQEHWQISTPGILPQREKSGIASTGKIRLAKVYNLEVKDAHEYFANNILVHNCASCAGTVVKELEERAVLYYPYLFAAAKFESGEDPDSWGNNLAAVGKALTKWGVPKEADVSNEIKQLSPAARRRFENYPDTLRVKAAEQKAQAYFFVNGPYDPYDNARAAMYALRDKNQGIVTGVVFGWSLDDFVLDGTPAGFGHALANMGWYEDGLQLLDSGGLVAGVAGFHKITRTTFNKYAKLYGMMMFTDMPADETKDSMIAKSQAYRAELLKQLSLLERIMLTLTNWFTFHQ